MLANPLYFCFGDYRGARRRYRIYSANSVDKAHDIAETCGYKVFLDEARKFDGIADMEERLVDAVLSALHVRFHGIENTVTCVRKNIRAAEELERHFMKSEIREYFPKFLDLPLDLGTPDHPVLFYRRPYPWMLPHVIRELKTDHGMSPKVDTMQLVTPRQAAFPLGEDITWSFLLDEPPSPENYDGFVTAVAQMPLGVQAASNLADYVKWTREFVTPRLNEVQSGIAAAHARFLSQEMFAQREASRLLQMCLAAFEERVWWLRTELSGKMARFAFFYPELERHEYRPKYTTIIETLCLFITQFHLRIPYLVENIDELHSIYQSMASFIDAGKLAVPNDGD